jgi:hypothetical protein
MLERIAIVATVSQSPQSLIRFCDYHLDLGVDHIFLYFDKSEENSITALKENNRITCISCTEDYWARLKTNRPASLDDRIIRNRMHGIRLCQDHGINFVAPIDADEFIYTNQNLRRALSQAFVSLDAVILFPYEAIHDKYSIRANPYEAKYFKVLPNRINKYVVPIFYSRIRELTDNGFFGHTAGKTLLRSSAEIVEYRNTHRPILADPSKMGKTNLLKLLHFDCALEEEWIRKWRNRFEGHTIATMRRKRERQYDEIKNALVGQGPHIRQLYRDYYLYNGLEIAVGRCLGLLHRMDAELSNVQRGKTREREIPRREPGQKGWRKSGP